MITWDGIARMGHDGPLAEYRLLRMDGLVDAVAPTVLEDALNAAIRRGGGEIIIISKKDFDALSSSLITQGRMTVAEHQG